MAAMAEPVDRSTDMYWKKAYGSLDESVRKDIDLACTARTDIDILETLLQTVEERRLVCFQKRTKITLPNGKVIILYEVVGKIAHWVRAFKAVGDVVLQCNPATAGLPWAALQFLLQAAITDNQIEGLIATNLETISRMIAKYREFENIYLTRVSTMNPQIEDCLTLLYADVLRYLGSAMRYFKSKSHGMIS